LLAPVETAAVGLILILASRPLAGFASRFAAISDTASHF
jgi:hypothetical protein